MKKNMIVDVVIVNSVMGVKGWERGEESQNQEVGICYQTGNQNGWGFATMSKTLDFQVSLGFVLFFLFTKGLSRLTIDCMLCKYIMRFCVQVKNKLCVECTVIMRLISWNHSRGSETVIMRYIYNVHRDITVSP
jgi:hypothetical protein